MCWDGNSGSWREWDKSGSRRRSGYFGGGELETTDLGSGIGMHSSVYPYFDGFRGLGVGFYLCLEDMSSPRSETEWAKPTASRVFTYTPPRRSWG
jgi:hypothetical protein